MSFVCRLCGAKYGILRSNLELIVLKATLTDKCISYVSNTRTFGKEVTLKN